MSDFKDVKPYTQAELDQQAIWANEFDQWWEDEGQYQRAGGGQYERSFAWWAWLNREQKQQAIIDDLKTQLNNMEACYIEKKKQVEECAALAAGWNEIAWDKTTHWTEGYEEGCYHCSAQIEEALRGGS